MASQAGSFNIQEFSDAGAPLSGGRLYTYSYGTTTQKTAYTDAAGTIPHTYTLDGLGGQYIALNSRGELPAPLYLTSGAYDLALKRADGSSVWTRRAEIAFTSTDAASSITAAVGSDGTLSFRNRLHNGNFVINQRAVSGTVTLAAGAYGHDRWKAGAAGCTYTFATVGNVTVITVTAGSLLQIVEATNVEGGVYTLVNQGSAQVRYGINGNTPSGSYFTASAASPLQTTSATANQQITVEFSSGTLDRVQLEPGTAATAFERRPISVETAICQRYYQSVSATTYFGWQGNAGDPFRNLYVTFTAQMRAAPTVSVINTGGTFAPSAITTSGFYANYNAGNTTTSYSISGYTASADL